MIRICFSRLDLALTGLYVKFKQAFYLVGGFAYILRLADHGSGPACASHETGFPKVEVRWDFTNKDFP